MSARRIIILMLVLFAAMPIIILLVYRPIIFWKDRCLAEKAEKIQVGMTVREVEELLGKPKEETIFSIEDAIRQGLSRGEAVKLQNEGVSILMHEFWTPMAFTRPAFFALEPARRIIKIYYNKDGKVIYRSIGEIPRGIYVGGRLYEQ